MGFFVLIDFSCGYYLLWIVFYITNIKMNMIKIAVLSEFTFYRARQVGKQKGINNMRST